MSAFMDAGVPSDATMEPDNHDSHTEIVAKMASALARLNLPIAAMVADKVNLAEHLVREGFVAADIVENLDDAIRRAGEKRWCCTSKDPAWRRRQAGEGLVFWRGPYTHLPKENFRSYGAFDFSEFGRFP